LIQNAKPIVINKKTAMRQRSQIPYPRFETNTGRIFSSLDPVFTWGEEHGHGAAVERVQEDEEHPAREGGDLVALRRLEVAYPGVDVVKPGLKYLYFIKNSNLQAVIFTDEIDFF
jgi:hypothetical protein